MTYIVNIPTNTINSMNIETVSKVINDLHISKATVDKTTLSKLILRKDTLLAGQSTIDLSDIDPTEANSFVLSANTPTGGSGSSEGGGTPFTVIDWNPYVEGGTHELVFTPIDENTQYVDGVISVPSGHTVNSYSGVRYMGLTTTLTEGYLGKLSLVFDNTVLAEDLNVNYILYSNAINMEDIITSWADGNNSPGKALTYDLARAGFSGNSDYIFDMDSNLITGIGYAGETASTATTSKIYLDNTFGNIPEDYKNLLVLIRSSDLVNSIPEIEFTQTSMTRTAVPETIDGNVIHPVGSGSLLCNTIVSVDSYCQMFNEGSEFILLSSSDQNSGGTSASEVSSNDVIWKGVDTVIPTMSLPVHNLAITIPANYGQSDAIYINVKDTVRNGTLIIANPSEFQQSIILQSDASSYLIGGTLVGDKWKLDLTDYGIGDAFQFCALSIIAVNGFINTAFMEIQVRSTITPPGFAPTYVHYDLDIGNTGTFLWNGTDDITVTVGIPEGLQLPVNVSHQYGYDSVSSDDIANGYITYTYYTANQLLSGLLYGNNTEILNIPYSFSNDGGVGPLLDTTETIQLIPKAPDYSNPEYSPTSGNTSASTYDLAVNCAGHSNGLGAPFKEGMILHISSDSSGAPEPTTSITLPYTILQSSPMIQVSGGGAYGLSIPYTLNSNGGTPYTIVFTAYWEADGLIGPTSTFTLNVTP